MTVRPRVEADLDRCVDLATAVHDVDGYPPYLPGNLREFVASPDTIGAWVAEHDGLIAGHVALHRSSWRAAMSLASRETGLPFEGLAFVARLFVAPGARRCGIGRSLLATASDEAVARGLRPVLDVAARFTAAVALYESCGWTCAGRVRFDAPDGSSFEELVYVGPSSCARATYSHA